MNDPNPAFAVQAQVRGPWRAYLDALAPLRPELHRYCARLTGSVWDGEDLAQDALVRVFSLLGKIDANLENPRAYLIRTATHLWIDRMRRLAREREILRREAAEPPPAPPEPADGAPAVDVLFSDLHPQERAALVMRDVLDLSLEETAAILQTTSGAVKAALSRARGRLADERPRACLAPPPRAVVERFLAALQTRDMAALAALCSPDLAIDMVGGARIDDFEHGQMFFQHAHMVFPALGFGENPWWELIDYQGEPMVVGYRTLNGVEGINEIHRLEAEGDTLTCVRCYCFAPDTLAMVGAEIGKPALARPYRSPSMG